MTKNNVKYYPSFKHARRCRNSLAAEYPNSRVVEYQLGWAVQYYLSGPYYPHFNMPRKGDL